jgi:hypothetical protein
VAFFTMQNAFLAVEYIFSLFHATLQLDSSQVQGLSSPLLKPFTNNTDVFSLFYSHFSSSWLQGKETNGTERDRAAKIELVLNFEICGCFLVSLLNGFFFLVSFFLFD